MAKKEKLMLIDAHALIHRAYHALPPMSTREGTPTQAVYGFVTMLLSALKTIKPTHVVAAFDEAGPTFRHEEFEDYKANRVKADDELIVQFDMVREVLEAFDIPVISKQGYEADDVIGTIVQTNPGIKKVIVTGDMDALQLVDEKTHVFTLKRGISDTITYTPEEVVSKYGFGPEYVTDYKGLRGDPSDNIPGVEGVGDKTAKDLIMEYGGIEKIYENLEDLPKRAKTRLTGNEDEALMSRGLATIKRDVKIEFNLDKAKLHNDNAARVREVLEKLEFRSLMDRLPKELKGNIQPTLFTSHPARQKAGHPLLMRGEGSDVLPGNYFLVESDEDKKSLIEKLSKQKVIAFDTETDQLGAREHEIIGLSVAFAVGKKIEAYYVPVSRKTLKDWQDILENEDIGKVGHNLKYDHEVVMQSGISLNGIVFDSMIASYLLHPDSRQHGMDAVAVQELGHHMIPISELIGEKKDGRMSEVNKNVLAKYACEDADISWQLYKKLLPEIKKEGLARILEDVELPLIEVLSHVELMGVAVDKKKLEKLEKQASERLEKLTKNIYKAAGQEFNVNSTVQLREVLYEKLNLPTEDIKKTQSGYSTAASELEKLEDKHEIIGQLQEYRELAKLLNTYIETLPKLVQDDGRIHASFNQTVAATGRLSSTDPNLQNIPVRTEMGQKIRGAFVASAGNVLVKADYSQLELRIAAHMSQDENMLQAFRDGEDIHAATAALVFGVDVKDVKPEQRRQAKTLNFGVLYGMGPVKFAREAKVSQEEARSFIERYQDQYAGITKMTEDMVEQAETEGYVETIWGRRRYLPEINSRNPGIRARAERMAFNFPIQGTEADIIKKAMIDLYAHIQEKHEQAKMILTVHDELVCEVDEKNAKKFAEEMKGIMSEVIKLDIPLEVDVACGKNWLDMEEI